MTDIAIGLLIGIAIVMAFILLRQWDRTRRAALTDEERRRDDAAQESDQIW